MKAVQPYAVYGLALACVLIFSVAAGCTSFVRGGRHGIVLNDLHSRLNPTRVAEVVSPRSTTDVVEAVRRALPVVVPAPGCQGVTKGEHVYRPV